LEPAVVLSRRASEVDNFWKSLANGQKGNQLAEVDGEFSDLGLWGRGFATPLPGSFRVEDSVNLKRKLSFDAQRLGGHTAKLESCQCGNAWEKGPRVFEITHFQGTNKEIHAY
jgi:hypothetical protein